MSLSLSEQRVANMIAEGKSNAEIGEALGVTEKTVKFHLTNIYAKENVRTRAQLIVKRLSASDTPSSEEIKAFREILK